MEQGKEESVAHSDKGATVAGNAKPPPDSNTLLSEGKRCLAAGDANGAVEFFQEACQQLASAHGQVSVELAEPYYLYGKALLELSRCNTSVLGSGIPVPEDKESSDEEMEEDEEESEKKGVAEEVPGEAQSSEPTSQTNEDAPEKTAANEEKQAGEADKTTDPVSSSTNGDAGPAAEGEATGSNGDAPAGNEGEGEKEEESDLEIAWEVLELARVICQKHETDEYRLKLSDVNLLLGEVGLESDQYEQAIMDMQSSLQLRQFVLEETDRRIAEVYFSLGLAYTLNKQFEDAIASYKKSKDTLEKRKAEAEGKLTSEKEDEKKKVMKSEIKELTELVPDIDSKISDVIEMKRLAEERAKEGGGEGEGEEGETTVGFGDSADDKKVDSSSSKAVTDITHLVRKRPAATDEANQPTAKKPCTTPSGEVVTNGNGTKAAEREGAEVNSTACEQ